MATSSRRAKPGGLDATQLVVKHLPMVSRICGARLARQADIDDAIQETFVQLLQADRNRIRNVDAWLARVATRVCGHFYRRQYDRPEVALPDDISVVDDKGLNEVLDLAWFRKMISHLSPLDRQALTLLYLHDMPRDVVAEQLGLTTGHLRVVAFRARRRAQRLISAYDDDMSL